MANATEFAWAGSLAYFFTRAGTSLSYRILGKYLMKRKDIEENLKLIGTLIRNMHRIGILDDDDIWKLLDYSLKIIISGKANPIEAEKFLLIYLNECIARYANVEMARLKEFFRDAKLLSHAPIIKEA